MNSKKGFTVLEIILCIIFVGVLLVLFFLQKQNIDAMQRDDQRRTAINAMFYALEEGYYAENQYYPENIEEAAVLPWIDPNLFTDPLDVNLWDSENESNYSYEASDCEEGRCKSYTLRATMEKEKDYVKNSRH